MLYPGVMGIFDVWTGLVIAMTTLLHAEDAF